LQHGPLCNAQLFNTELEGFLSMRSHQ